MAPVEPRFRLANKLAMLDGKADDDTEVLVALDSDIVVAGDFSAYVDPDLVQAKPPDGDLLTIEMWRELFAYFNLSLPAERHPTSLSEGWTHAYFNTGVITIPGSVLRPLHDRWLHFIRAVLDARGVLPGLLEHFTDRIPDRNGAITDELNHLYYAEQWAFALARADLNLAYAVLPLDMNFPTICFEDQQAGRYIRERSTPHVVEPLLLHHHHEFKDGLVETGYTTPDETIRRINPKLFRKSGRRPAAPL